jgi:hypothetical protein
MPRTKRNEDQSRSDSKKEPNLGQKEARQQEKGSSDMHHMEKGSSSDRKESEKP